MRLLWSFAGSCELFTLWPGNCSQRRNLCGVAIGLNPGCCIAAVLHYKERPYAMHEILLRL